MRYRYFYMHYTAKNGSFTGTRSCVLSRRWFKPVMTYNIVQDFSKEIEESLDKEGRISGGVMITSWCELGGNYNENMGKI